MAISALSEKVHDITFSLLSFHNNLSSCWSPGNVKKLKWIFNISWHLGFLQLMFCVYDWCLWYIDKMRNLWSSNCCNKCYGQIGQSFPAISCKWIKRVTCDGFTCFSRYVELVYWGPVSSFCRPVWIESSHCLLRMAFLSQFAKMTSWNPATGWLCSCSWKLHYILCTETPSLFWSQCLKL